LTANDSFLYNAHSARSVNLCDKDFARDVAALMCGVRTEKVSWNASFPGFDAGDFIAAGPVTNDFCFQIRQTWALQRNAPVRTERVNPPAATANPAAATVNPAAATANPAAATVNPAGVLHAGRERKCFWGKRHSDATFDSLTTERMLRRRPSSNARPGKPPSSGSPFASAQLQLSPRLWMPAPPLGARLFQLALEGVGTITVPAQTSGGFAETH
jgi:hypothetical protein